MSDTDCAATASRKPGRCSINLANLVLLYRSILEEQDPDRVLFLGIPDEAAEMLAEPIGQLLISKHLILALVFDPSNEEVLRWIP